MPGGFAFQDVRAASFNAAAFVTKANEYGDKTINIQRLGVDKIVNAKSLLGVLSLNLSDKDVRITVSGGQNQSSNLQVAKELAIFIA